MYSVQVEKLAKKFDKFTAVDAISFNIKEGEIFGLLGPNGAGKTTTISMLATLLKPTSGTAKINGFEITKQKDDVRKSIGIVFQDPALDNRLTGRENLEFHGRMYNMPEETRNKKINEVLNLVELNDKADIQVQNYSGGMKRRLEIARGLMHNPKVLFLDEPTLGLDAQTRRHIWEYISKLNKEKKVTIVLTTHYMEEADYLCERVAIIDHGKIVALDTSKKLKECLGGDVISLEISAGEENLIKKLKTISWIKEIKKHDGTISLTMDHGAQRIPELMEIAKIAKVDSVELHRPSLEDVFIHYTGKTIIETEASQKDKFRQIRMRMHG